MIEIGSGHFSAGHGIRYIRGISIAGSIGVLVHWLAFW